MPPRPPRPESRRPPQTLAHCSRWTGPRHEVFNLLVQTQQHLSAKDIFSALRASSPDLGLTTVYRTLDLLDKAGLVRRVTGLSGEVRFEYRRADQSDHHHHLMCTGCGKIVNYRDFEHDELELVRRTEDRLARRHGFLIRDHNIEFLGLCPDCQPGGARSPLGSPSGLPARARGRRPRRTAREETP